MRIIVENMAQRNSHVTCWVPIKQHQSYQNTNVHGVSKNVHRLFLWLLRQMLTELYHIYSTVGLAEEICN